MTNIKNGTYIAIYDTGFTVHFPCKVNLDTKQVFAIEQDNEALQDVEVEQGFFVKFEDGTQYPLEVCTPNERGSGYWVNEHDFINECISPYASTEENCSEMDDNPIIGYVCKYCGEAFECLEDEDFDEWFDEFGEEMLWGHLQYNHEKVFDAIEEYETPFMLEECYDEIREYVQEEKTEDKRNEMVFAIPVCWQVSDFVMVSAASLEDALEYVSLNQDTIELGSNPSYVSGSYEVLEATAELYNNENGSNIPCKNLVYKAPHYAEE